MPRRKADEQHVTQQAGHDGAAGAANQSHTRSRRKAATSPDRSPAQDQGVMAHNVLADDEDQTLDEDDFEDDELLVIEGGTVTIEGGTVTIEGGTVTIEGGMITITGGRSIDEDELDAADHLGDEEDVISPTPIAAENPQDTSHSAAAPVSPGSPHNRRKKK